MQDGTVLAFGEFRLRLAPAALYRRGAPVRLQAQPLRLLVLLVSRAGQLVTHREIQRHLWQDHVVDFTGGMHVCMRQIRGALDEEAGEPRYIETVARHGYRFIAPVRAVALDEPASADAAPRAADRARRPATRHAVAAALVAVAALLASSEVQDRLAVEDAAAAANADPRVEELYGNARQLASYDQMDRQVLALDLLRRALAIEPTHGPSHALIADLITMQGAASLGIEGAGDADLVAHHLDIASRHGAKESDMLVTRGRQYLYENRRLRRAEDMFRRAVAADPGNAIAWRLSAEALYLQGRFDEALRASEQAEALSADPNGVLWDRLQIYYLSGRFDELFALHERLDDVQRTGSITIGVAMELTGRHADAFDYIVDALRYRGIVIGDAAGARRSVRAGSTKQAYRWLLAEIRRNEKPTIGGKAIAILQTLAGDRAGAAATIREYVRRFERMEEGTHVDCLCFLTLPLDPFFAQLRDEPLVQEAWVAIDASIARETASAAAHPARAPQAL